MKGKDKCEFLKGIRKRMAEVNGIPYEPRECTYEGDCTGTCPFCEKEAAELLTKLKEKEAEGAEIKTDNVGISAIELGINECQDSHEGEEVNIVLTGAEGTLIEQEKIAEVEEPPGSLMNPVDDVPLMGDFPDLEEDARLEDEERARRGQQEYELKTKIERHPDFEKYLSELSWIKIEDDKVLASKSGFYLFSCLAENHVSYDLLSLKKGEQLCKFYLSHPYKLDVKPIEYYYVEEDEKQYILWGLSRLES